MKKKLLVAAMSCMLMAGAVTGCGSKTADAPTTVAATEAVTTESADAESTEATDAESTEAADAESTEAVDAAEVVSAEGSYLGWSGKEWNAADDAEKTAAAREYLIETTKVAAKAAGQEFTAEMEATITDEQVATVQQSLVAAFSQDENITIQEMLDMATDMMNSMMETEAAAE